MYKGSIKEANAVQRCAGGTNRDHMAEDADLVVPGPFHSVDATDALICKLREGAWREIQVLWATPYAAIGKGDSDAVAIVGRRDFLVAEGVVVGVCAIVTRVSVEQSVRDSRDEICVGIGDTASSQASAVESAVTTMKASKKVSIGATTICGGRGLCGGLLDSSGSFGGCGGSLGGCGSSMGGRSFGGSRSNLGVRRLTSRRRGCGYVLGTTDGGGRVRRGRSHDR